MHIDCHKIAIQTKLIAEGNSHQTCCQVPKQDSQQVEIHLTLELNAYFVVLKLSLAMEKEETTFILL